MEVKIVDRVFNLENQLRGIVILESEIDQLIYQLYGLTEEEIKIVEGEK